jgi:hypothetical protein
MSVVAQTVTLFHALSAVAVFALMVFGVVQALQNSRESQG